MTWKTSAPASVTLKHLAVLCKRLFTNVISITPDEVKNRVVIKTSYTFKSETIKAKLNIVPALGQHVKWTSNGSLTTEEEGDLDELLAIVGVEEPESWSTPTAKPAKRRREVVDDSGDEAEPITYRKTRAD